jgi:hypothetical protein
MFLIEFSKDTYINAETINWLSLDNELVRFTCAGESDKVYFVDKGIEGLFLNHLQVLNDNITDVSIKHHHINNPNT